MYGSEYTNSGAINDGDKASSGLSVQEVGTHNRTLRDDGNAIDDRRAKLLARVYRYLLVRAEEVQATQQQCQIIEARLENKTTG